mmetsp:Transcript_14204/g.29063  ORF Transcript_14204/g.29063 Transcript_14204/m.29063 type:complete len:146 (-) Transcript_14204:1874-2311(-)
MPSSKSLHQLVSSSPTLIHPLALNRRGRLEKIDFRCSHPPTLKESFGCATSQHDSYLYSRFSGWTTNSRAKHPSPTSSIAFAARAPSDPIVESKPTAGLRPDRIARWHSSDARDESVCRSTDGLPQPNLLPCRAAWTCFQGHCGP